MIVEVMARAADGFTVPSRASRRDSAREFNRWPSLDRFILMTGRQRTRESETFAGLCTLGHPPNAYIGAYLR
jgi:hypothetical protein